MLLHIFLRYAKYTDFILYTYPRPDLTHALRLSIKCLEKKLLKIYEKKKISDRLHSIKILQL